MSDQLVASAIKSIRTAFPCIQAIYLFGSTITKDRRPGSDIDIALLLPPGVAEEHRSLAISDLRVELEDVFRCDIDLINLRKVSTVFQKEIVSSGLRIDTGDEYAAEMFEMLVISLYQKLNDERADILDAFMRTKRAYPV